MPQHNQDRTAVNKEIIDLLLQIKSQNAEQIKKIEAQSQQIETLEKTAAKRGAVAGGVTGGIAGSAAALGIEFIKAKLGM